MLKVPLDRIDKIREHVVGIAVDRVADVLLRNAVAFGQSLQDWRSSALAARLSA